MKFLLDTQVWLWTAMAPERLSRSTRARLKSAESELFLSAATTWEIAIKHSLGKLRLPEPVADYVAGLLSQTQVTPLPIQHRHALRVAHLPPKHSDPFDRLLIAQAQLEGLPIVTADRSFAQYDVKVVWA